MPKVSIIIPIYNTEKRLYACLDSIIAQSFSDYEAILVDDGSTDGSRRICEEYAAKDSRFVVVHKDNEGLASARITGFEHSKGDYITFIDSDDIVNSLYLKKLYNTIIEKDADITCCQVIRVYDNNKVKEKHSIFGTFDKIGIRNFLSQNYLHDKRNNKTGMPLYMWGKLYKKEFLGDGLRAGLGLKLGEDQISLFYMLLRINRISIIQDYLYEYIFHEGQITAKYKSDFWDNKLEVFRRYQKLDNENLLVDQLPLRMWRVLINGIEGKMLNMLSSYSRFKEMVVPVLENDTFRCLFNKKMLPHGFKKNIKFWILKYKLFHIYYTIFIRHYYSKII